MVTVGKYDGKHPALTCATTAGKVRFSILQNKKGFIVWGVKYNVLVDTFYLKKTHVHMHDVIKYEYIHENACTRNRYTFVSMPMRQQHNKTEYLEKTFRR